MIQFFIITTLLRLCIGAYYFYVSNEKIMDPNGRLFYFRGINSEHSIWDTRGRHFAKKSLSNIALTGANSVRIMWRTTFADAERLSVSDLDLIIQEVINLQMVPIVQLNDVTCSNSKDDLVNMANWWKKNSGLLFKYKKYIFLNIANKWGNWNTPDELWRDAYKQAIGVIRSIGWGGPIVVDGSSCGQDPNAIIKYGRDIVDSDPYHNTLFSLHMYQEWKKGGRFSIYDKLTAIQSKGLAVLVGEFAMQYIESCTWKYLDPWEIMRQCKAKRIGYLGWSWQGNGAVNESNCQFRTDALNMVKGYPETVASWVNNNYTEWGWNIVNYKDYGIKDTSYKASIFY